MNDLISRKWLMECVNEGWIKFDTEKDKNIYVHLVRDIAPSAQPEVLACGEGELSAQPERKTGHWIKTARWGRVYYCDQCRNYLDFDGVNAGRGSTNFCPNCGANMKGEQDD